MHRVSLPPVALIEEELAHLVASDALRRAPSHTRLLRYLVDQRIRRDEVALCETSIALAVFQRNPATFNPQADPIVRVTTGRLRQRLALHYARGNAAPKLRIVLPKGRYAPEFIVEARGPATAQGLAILRTRNLTTDPDCDTLCAICGDRLGDSLARIGVPRVIARDSVDQAQRNAAAPSELGQLLGVEWLLDSFLAVEPHGLLRLSARLVRSSDASVAWVETGARPVDDRDALTETIVDRVAGRFAASLRGVAHGSTGPELPALTATERNDLELAHMLVCERDPLRVDHALALARRIVAANPGVARAWGTLALAEYNRLAFMDRDFAACSAAARATARQALAIDPDQPDAALVEGMIDGMYELQFGTAERRLRRVLRDAPRHSFTRQSLASLLLYQGEFDRALDELDVAVSHDPLSVTPRMIRANVLTYARRHDDARCAWEMSRAAGGSVLWTSVLAGNNELWDGRLDRAEALYAAVAQSHGDNPTPAMCLGFVYARRGEAARARSQLALCLQRFPVVSTYQQAMLAGALRDKSGVLGKLQEARARRDVLCASACIDPTFDWLAGDRDFNHLLHTWGLVGWRGRERAGGASAAGT